MPLTHNAIPGKTGLALALLGLLVPSAVAYAQTPVSWWKADGNALDSVGGNNGTLQGGVTYGSGIVNQGFVFNGTNGVVHIPDAANLAITGSLSITADVLCNQLSSNGLGGAGQIFFRGDNRAALDPYTLGVNASGLFFQIDNASGQVAIVQAPMPLHQFVFIDASLNDATGQMLLSINHQMVAQTTTTIRPFKDLEPTLNPGIGIGNTQDPSFANEPFNGTIDELKVYNTVVSPAVPEASTTVSFGLLLCLGLGGMVWSARRKKGQAGE